MSRWAPNARERLKEAAWELFAENGYEETTVAQIAERAGLNRATFFRHFADKREILFGGEDTLGSVLVDAIRTAPAEAGLAECLRRALVATGAIMTSDEREKVALRRRVADTSTEVQERGLAKNAKITADVAQVLRDRGVKDPDAQLGAQLTMLAFAAGGREWLEARSDEDFAHHALAAFAALQASAVRVGSAADADTDSERLRAWRATRPSSTRTLPQ